MNGGEFRERLVEPFIEVDDHVCPESILAVLEEARKEFPFQLIPPNTNLEMEIHSNIWNGELVVAVKLAEWFEKWFGSGDE